MTDITKSRHELRKNFGVSPVHLVVGVSLVLVMVCLSGVESIMFCGLGWQGASWIRMILYLLSLWGVTLCNAYFPLLMVLRWHMPNQPFKKVCGTWALYLVLAPFGFFGVGLVALFLRTILTLPLIVPEKSEVLLVFLCIRIGLVVIAFVAAIVSQTVEKCWGNNSVPISGVFWALFGYSVMSPSLFIVLDALG